MGGTANPFLMILWFVIPFLFLFYAYLVLFSTSSYLIVQILKLRKNGALTKGQCILHIMMQLLFFIDVVDSVYLFFKYRKCNWMMKSITFATDPFTSHLYITKGHRILIRTNPGRLLRATWVCSYEYSNIPLFFPLPNEIRPKCRFPLRVRDSRCTARLNTKQ